MGHSCRSAAGNTNTLAGNIPPKASLGDMSGLASGLGEGTTAMIDGLDFDGAKARPARPAGALHAGMQWHGCCVMRRRLC